MAYADDVIRQQAALDPGRFTRAGGPRMLAVVTTGQGGLEKLDVREVSRPQAAAGEVLLQVLAAGVNATDVNTRVGWYSAAVAAGTGGAAEAAESGRGAAGTPAADGGWSGAVPFPLIQGTDCCGRVVAAGPGVDRRLIGRRALVRPCMRPLGFGSLSTVWMGSDFDGAFAQFVKAPASEVFPVDCDWTDAELGAVPCAAGTAENMLCRARVATGDRVLVTGASGGVGSALVQLARRRGARVVAAAAAAKAHWVLGLGAERVVDADADLVAELGEHSVDVVADNVAGPGLDRLLDVLARGGRYVSSGAVAGPRVAFDKRIFYLKDLTLFGCTAWDEPVFADVVAAVEAGDLRPVVGRTFPLTRIADAQLELLARRGSGKIVLVP